MSSWWADKMAGKTPAPQPGPRQGAPVPPAPPPPGQRPMAQLPGHLAPAGSNIATQPAEEVEALDNVQAMQDPNALVQHNTAVLNRGQYNGELPAKAHGMKNAQECPECGGTNYFAPSAGRLGESTRRCMDCGYPFVQRGSGMITQEPTKGTARAIQPDISHEGKVGEVTMRL